MGALDRLHGAASLLDRHERRPRLADLDLVEAEILPEEFHLVALAAEADHHVARDVRMAREADVNPAQRVEGVARLHVAAALVGEGDDAVDVRIVAPELRRAEAVTHIVRDRGRAVDAGDDGDIVSGTDAAVGPQEAAERPRLRHRREFLEVGAELIIASEVLHAQVVGVDVVARRDGGRREPDDLSVLADGRFGGDVVDRDLVALGNVLFRLEGPLPVHQREPRADRFSHDGDVIRGMQLQGEVVEPFGGH